MEYLHSSRILHKLEFHYTPKHANWLNMAEIEISVLDRQCLDRLCWGSLWFAQKWRRGKTAETNSQQLWIGNSRTQKLVPNFNTFTHQFPDGRVLEIRRKQCKEGSHLRVYNHLFWNFERIIFEKTLKGPEVSALGKQSSVENFKWTQRPLAFTPTSLIFW